MISIVIPAFNEEGAIRQTIEGLHAAFTKAGEPFELVAVDDGSTDDTLKILESIRIPELTIVRTERNRGNGAAIRAGVDAATGDVIGTVDADGTYPLKEYPALLLRMRKEGAAMIVGARTKPGASIPWTHRPAKWILSMLVFAVTRKRVADINSGMRIVSRELFDRFRGLYPDRFSLHITLTVAALCAGESIVYEPIEYYPRIGQSTMTQGMNGVRHFGLFIIQILQTAAHCDPRIRTVVQFGLYLVSGTGAATVNYGSYLLLLWGSMYYLAASVISEILGFFSAFVLHKYIVFQKRGTVKKHFGRYCVLQLWNFFAVNMILYACVEWLGIGEEFSKLIGIVAVVLWNFVLYKLVVYV